MIKLNLTAETPEHEVLKEYLQENASSVLAEKIEQGVKIVKDGKTLIRYAAARPEAAFTVPFGVTEIQSGAFAGCRSLRRLMIYKNVERIQESAFSNVSSLTVYCKAEQKPSGWANNLFSDSVTVEWNNSSYYLPDGKLYVW